MSSKISFRGIVAAHLDTLRNYDSGRYRPADFILFFALPTAAASLALYFGTGSGEGAHTSLILFAGLNGVAMVSALSLLLHLANGAHANVCAQSDYSPVRLRLIRETHANVFFTLLVAVLLATAAVVRAVLEPHGGSPATSLPRQSAAFICIYLAGNLFLSLLLVLRRLSVLLTKELEAD